MSLNNYTLLDTTIYGEASGNYDGSSQDFHGDPVIAADYYRGYGGLQSVRYRLNDFVGIIYVEATLDPTAIDANWFTTLEIGDGSTVESVDRSQSVIGNFTWMRVRVANFTAGIIDSITLTY